MEKTSNGDAAAFDVSDVVYLRHGATEYQARVYRPRGAGPFPAIVDVHGGAWVNADRLQCETIHRAFAASGIVVFSLDFRLPPAAMYPGPVADINFGIRYLKANAERFGTRADLVGALGTSSGGHQLLLNVLRPHDARYTIAPLAGGEAVDARVAFVVIGWAVSDPHARYRVMIERGNQRLVDAHHAYWPAEADMIEGNPQLILERGEAELPLPPLLSIQGTNDGNLTHDMATRLVAAYRAAGGEARLEEYADQEHKFVTDFPDAEPSLRAVEVMIGFIHQCVATVTPAHA